ncbi:MAG TPA: hypothetical protein DCZ41_02930 [Firmicutes bacterium]|nr:hypothetical protein [Bacillota bacterium]
MIGSLTNYAIIDRGKKKDKPIAKDEAAGTLFTILPIVWIAVFTFFPLLMAFYISICDTTSKTSVGFTDAVFLGFSNLFDNYKEVFASAQFWEGFRNNLILFVELPISICLSIVIAEFLSKKVRFTNTFKVIMFIPYVCSVVATTYMWNQIFNTKEAGGILNNMFGTNFPWLSEGLIWAVMIMGLWSSLGYRILLFTAAITNVNGSLKEAARIDGAGPVKVFLHVTIPAITPTIFYVLVMGMIGIFQEFTRINIVSNGYNYCPTMVGFIYRYRDDNAGVACAASVILALFIFTLTRLNFYFSKKWVTYDVD